MPNSISKVKAQIKLLARDYGCRAKIEIDGDRVYVYTKEKGWKIRNQVMTIEFSFPAKVIENSPSQVALYLANYERRLQGYIKSNHA